MKIEHVTIDNSSSPILEWWTRVKERPSEPLIEATISMKLSWDEYDALLKQNERERSARTSGPR